MKQKIAAKSWIEIGIAAAIFVALAAVAALYDLTINIKLYNPSSFFGQYFAKLGELPSYLTAPFVGGVLFNMNFGKTKRNRVLFKLLGAVISVVGSFFAVGMWFWKNFITAELEYAMLYKIVFSIIVGMAVVGLCALIPKKHRKTVFLFAIFLGVSVALSNIIVQIMKVIWARQRFRTMVDIEKNASLIALYGNDFAGFSPWYKPQLIVPNEVRTKEYEAIHKAIDSDSFKSFPSGHTVAASATFGLLIVPDLFPKFNTKKAKWFFWFLPIAYTSTVAISRIIMGAHYLSDVLFGGYVGATCALVVRFLMLRKFFPLLQRKFPEFMAATSYREPIVKEATTHSLSKKNPNAKRTYIEVIE